MTSKLSVVVNTYNEAKILPKALASAKGLADEIVVVDMESEDGSAATAKKFGAKVFTHKKLNYVEPARNFGIAKADGDWILILDPDEEISATLSKNIKDIIKNGKADYYRIPRKNMVFGSWLEHSRWWPDYNIRLFRKGSVSWNEVIHGVPMTLGTGGEIEAKESLAIIHNHYNSIEQYVERMNRYTSVQASTMVKEGYDFSWMDLIKKPSDEFLSRYFSGKGYLDGIHGLAVSLLQGFSELILYLKVWQADKFKEDKVSVAQVISQMGKSEKDLHYWQNDALYKETGNISARIKRKLRI